MAPRLFQNGDIVPPFNWCGPWASAHLHGDLQLTEEKTPLFDDIGLHAEASCLCGLVLFLGALRIGKDTAEGIGDPAPSRLGAERR